MSVLLRRVRWHQAWTSVPLFTAALALAACGPGHEEKPPEPIRVAITPEQVTLKVGESAVLTARVEGTEETGVTWEADAGQFEPTDGGVRYFAPFEPGVYEVWATSVADPEASASTEVTVVDPSLQARRIRFVGDQSFVFTAPGQTRRVEVEVLDVWGEPIDDARVSFEVTDPAFAEVIPEGPRAAIVKVKQDAVGSTTLRVLADDGAEGRATLLFAKVAPETVLLDSQRVLDTTRDPATDALIEVVLERSTETEALQPGDLILTGDAAGVMARVRTVSVETDTVVAEVEDVPFTDVFEALEVDVETATLSWEPHLAPDAPLSLEGSAEATRTPLSLSDIHCRTESGGSTGVEVSGPHVRTVLGLRLRTRLSISDWTVRHFSLALEGRAGVRGESGRLTFSSEAAARVLCTAELPSVELPALPVSVLSFVFKLTPEAGAQGHARFEGPSFRIRGPEGHAIATATAGIAYEKGWQVLGEADLDRGFSPFAADVDWNYAFHAGAGPYAKVDARMDVLLGRGVLSFSLVEAAFADVEASGGIDLSIERPLDPSDRGYRGPRWSLGYQAAGHLKAELTGGALAKIAQKLGLDVPTLSTELFQIEGTLASSPVPSLTTRGTRFDLGIPEQRRIQIAIGAETQETGTAQVYRGSQGQGELTLLDEAPFTGGAAVLWTPTKGEVGRWDLFGRLAAGTLGSIKPYGNDQPAAVEIVSPFLAPPESVAMTGIVGETATGTATIQNTPADPTLGSDLVGTISGSGSLAVAPSSFRIPPGEAAAFALSYPCDSEGEFDATLTVASNDPEAGTVSIPTTIHCGENQPPTIDLGPSGPLSGTAPLLVTIAWGITDPENQPVHCSLDYGDGSPVEAIADCLAETSRTHEYGDGGHYVVTLSATDDHGATATAQLTIEVNGKPQITTFVADPVIGDPPLNVSYTFQATDPDGDALICTLDFGAGGGPMNVPCDGQASFEYAQEGTYQALFTADDGRGGITTATVSVQVGVGPCDLMPTPFGTDANGYAWLDFYYDPATGTCHAASNVLGWITFDADSLDTNPRFYVIDGGISSRGEVFMAQAPQPNAGWTPNYFQNKNLAYLLPNTPTLIVLEIRDANGNVLDTYQGTFEILFGGVGSVPQLQVTGFDRVTGP
ncbi:MAG: hypothetical protein D6729_16660 [Deltaproteobacteria bacterium]|nr:MAG: hypothetical protein D6729_16660 [Deltaproteobacteria bacterium]